MSELVHEQSRGDVVVLVVDNPPVNALSPGVPEAIEAAVKSANANARIASIVIAGAGRTFMAGADIRQFEHGWSTAVEDYLMSLLVCLRVIEESPKPVVMAIHGNALGAGLETAMAGHYRVMAVGAKAGQPEVKLGLIPGAGGTQRLPRLVGARLALAMCVYGEPISAQDALTCGLVDKIAEGDLITEACYFARQAVGLPVVKTRERVDRLGEGTHEFFAEAREKARENFPHLEAPLLAIDAIEAAVKLPFHEGMHFEERLFRQCLRSAQSRALIYLFFAERAAAKNKTGDAAREVVSTRMMGRCQAEAESMMREGVSEKEIRRALQDFGMKVVFALKEPEGASGNRGADAAEIVRRMTQAMADEGAKMLREGVVLRESDIDVISVLACGFPAWRGGPMFYARL